MAKVLAFLLVCYQIYRDLFEKKELQETKDDPHRFAKAAFQSLDNRKLGQRLAEEMKNLKIGEIEAELAKISKLAQFEIFAFKKFDPRDFRMGQFPIVSRMHEVTTTLANNKVALIEFYRAGGGSAIADWASGPARSAQFSFDMMAMLLAAHPDLIDMALYKKGSFPADIYGSFEDSLIPIKVQMFKHITEKGKRDHLLPMLLHESTTPFDERRSIFEKATAGEIDINFWADLYEFPAQDKKTILEARRSFQPMEEETHYVLRDNMKKFVENAVKHLDISIPQHPASISACECLLELSRDRTCVAIMLKYGALQRILDVYLNGMKTFQHFPHLDEPEQMALVGEYPVPLGSNPEYNSQYSAQHALLASDMEPNQANMKNHIPDFNIEKEKRMLLQKNMERNNGERVVPVFEQANWINDTEYSMFKEFFSNFRHLLMGMVCTYPQGVRFAFDTLLKVESIERAALHTKYPEMEQNLFEALDRIEGSRVQELDTMWGTFMKKFIQTERMRDPNYSDIFRIVTIEHVVEFVSLVKDRLSQKILPTLHEETGELYDHNMDTLNEQTERFFSPAMFTMLFSLSAVFPDEKCWVEITEQFCLNMIKPFRVNRESPKFEDQQRVNALGYTSLVDWIRDPDAKDINGLQTVISFMYSNSTDFTGAGNSNVEEFKGYENAIGAKRKKLFKTADVYRLIKKTSDIAVYNQAVVVDVFRVLEHLGYDQLAYYYFLMNFDTFKRNLFYLSEMLYLADRFGLEEDKTLFLEGMMELDPTNKQIVKQQLMTCDRTEQYDKMLHAAIKFRELDSDSADCLLLMGKAHRNLGNYLYAFSIFRDLAFYAPEDPYIFLELGNWAIDLGMHVHALTFYIHALNMELQSQHNFEAMMPAHISNVYRLRHDFEDIARKTIDYVPVYQKVEEIWKSQLKKAVSTPTTHFYIGSMPRVGDPAVVQTATEFAIHAEWGGGGWQRIHNPWFPWKSMPKWSGQTILSRDWRECAEKSVLGVTANRLDSYKAEVESRVESTNDGVAFGLYNMFQERRYYEHNTSPPPDPPENLDPFAMHESQWKMFLERFLMVQTIPERFDRALGAPRNPAIDKAAEELKKQEEKKRKKRLKPIKQKHVPKQRKKLGVWGGIALE